MSGKGREPAPEEVLRSIEEQEIADELERVKAMTDAEVEASLRKRGFDLDEIARRTQDNVQKIEEKRKKLEAQKKREAWEPKAVERLRKAQQILARPGITKTRGLTREQLLARIEAAKNDPRLSGPIAVAYRGVKLEEASEERLEAILEAIEDIAILNEDLD